MRSIRIFIAVLAVFLGTSSAVSAAITDDIAKKQEQIQVLQQQIEAYQVQLDQTGAQTKTLQNEIKILNAKIGQITAQIASLRASIDETDLEIQQTNTSILEAEHTIDLYQQALGDYLRETDSFDRVSLAAILLEHDVLSDFFDHVHQVERTQDNLRQSIASIREVRQRLDGQLGDLEDKQTQLEHLKKLTEVQQRDLASVKSTKNTILVQTKGQESRYQQLIKQTKTDLTNLQQQLYYLQQNGISVADAAKYAQLAAIGAGIRPAFLLALLEVESRLGLNVGTGNWKDDMYLCYQRLANIARTPERRQMYLRRAETEKTAFFKITTPLGLNPDSVKVSREPSYGCGGAMGPAQFIPSTWLSYVADIIRITGHTSPSPWNTEDAFTAAAVKLARGGATSKTRAGEVAAAKAYISGSPNCTQAICNSYANTIQSKAAQIERNL